MRRFLSILITAAMLLTLCVPALAVNDAADEETLVIVHTNDVHGHSSVEPYVKAVADSMKETYGEDHVLTLSAGDVAAGDMLATLSKGEYALKLMNSAGYDAMALGNNEFNFGADYMISTMAGFADFPILAANYLNADGEVIFNDYVTFERAGVKVGVYGLTPTMLPTHPALGDCSTPDSYEVSEATVAAMQEDGCQVIVALTHMGFDETGLSYNPNSNTLADTVEGIDLVVDGHSHSVVGGDTMYVSAATGIPVVQAGEYGDYIGVVYLHLTGGTVSSVESRLIPREEYEASYTPDSGVQALYEEYSGIIQEQVSQVIGSTEYDLVYDKQLVRAGETNLTDFVSDAVRTQLDADIAFFPGAKIRNGIAAGSITMQDLMNVVANGSKLYKVTLTGAEIRTFINTYIQKLPEQWYQYQQVSGLTYTYVLSSGGNYVVDISLPDGTPLDDEGEYTVIVDQSTDELGIDYSASSPLTTDVADTAELLAAYITSGTCTFRAEAEGRSAETAPVPGFPDVDPDCWYAAAVITAEEKNMISGYPDGTFGGANPITREEFAAITARMLGLLESGTDAFSDTAGRWSYGIVSAAYNTGLITGYPDGTFLPAENVTREQAMAIIARAAAYAGIPLTPAEDLSAFGDADAVSSWAADSVKALVGSGLINGDTAGNLNPKASMTRAETVTVLVRLAALLDDSYDTVLKIVHTNDIAGEISAEPYVAGIRALLEDEYGADNVLQFSSGDVVNGNAIAAISNGVYPIEAMNAAGYDAMVLGNAELGHDNFISEYAEMFDFPTLAANYYKADGTPEFDGTAVFNCGGVKVGVFGLVYDMPSDNPGAADGHYTSENVTDPAAECVAALEAEDCDVIIALTHIGFGDSYVPYDDATLADSVAGIDLICGGHSEVVLLDPYVGSTGAKVVMAGGDGAWIGVSTIYLKAGEVVNVSDELLPMAAYKSYAPDETVKALTDSYEEEINSQIMTVVGSVPYDLNGAKADIRSIETNLGDFVTDALRSYADTDIALFPGLKIRSSVAAGDVTLKDLMDVVANGATIHTVEITGQDLWDLVADYLNDPMHYQQISGAAYTYTVNEAGTRTIASLTVGGEPVQLDKVYTLATDEAPASFCDAIAANLGAPVLEGMADFAVSVLQAYLNSEDCVILSAEEAVTRCAAE